MRGPPVTSGVSRVLSVILCLGLACGGCGPQTTADPAEQIRIGWDQYRMAEFNRAVAAFEKARAATTEDNPLHVQALYGLATTWNLRRPSRSSSGSIPVRSSLVPSAV